MGRKFWSIFCSETKLVQQGWQKQDKELIRGIFAISFRGVFLFLYFEW